MQNPLRQRLVTSALAFLVGMGIGNAAVARDIAGPHVKAGEFRLKNSGFLGFNDNDNSRLSNSTELSYGLTDRIALKAEGDWNKGYSDRMRYRNTELKAQYELFQPGEAWIDTAVELGYAAAADPNRADEVNFEFLLQKDYLRMRHRANIEFAQQVGEFSEGGATTTVKAFAPAHDGGGAQRPQPHPAPRCSDLSRTGPRPRHSTRHPHIGRCPAERLGLASSKDLASRPPVHLITVRTENKRATKQGLGGWDQMGMRLATS